MKKIIAVVGAGLVVIIIVALWNLGTFQRIEMKTEEVEPLTVVYLEHKGPYHKIVRKITEVENILKEKNIPIIEGFREYCDDPQKVKSEGLRNIAGLMISGSAAVIEFFKTEVISGSSMHRLLSLDRQPSAPSRYIRSLANG